MFLSVIIATKGRPGALRETLSSLAGQTAPPDEIIVSATEAGDVAEVETSGRAKVIVGPAGLTVQRNAGIRALNPAGELVLFLDDDVELAPDYCQELRDFLRANAGVSGVGGRLLMDGATRQQARHAIQKMVPATDDAAHPVSSLYGCNMAFRRSAIVDQWFDERLGLYAFLEDYDFFWRVAQQGRLVCRPRMALCHLRSPSARVSHRAFGFAQVMNPWYLSKKGVINRRQLWRSHLLVSIAGNLWHLPGDFVNRWNRLRGNFRALALITRGIVRPEAVRDVRS